MTESKQKILIALKKAQSHIGKVIKMVEQDEYCISVMQQNLATSGLLKSAHKLLMERHLQSCFKSAMNTKDQDRKEDMINEILTVSRLANR